MKFELKLRELVRRMNQMRPKKLTQSSKLSYMITQNKLGLSLFSYRLLFSQQISSMKEIHEHDYKSVFMKLPVFLEDRHFQLTFSTSPQNESSARLEKLRATGSTFSFIRLARLHQWGNI